LGALLLRVLVGALWQDPASVDEVVELRWQAPASCPDEAVVRRRLERALLERDATPVEPTTIDVEVTALDEGGHALVMLVRMGDRVGRRTLEGVDCEALADAAVLVVAVALDPGGEVDLETLESPDEAFVPPPVEVTGEEGEPSAPREPSAPNPAPPLEEQERGKPPRPVFFAQTGVGVGVGILPRVGPSINVSAGPRGRYWVATLGGSFWFRRDARVPEHPEVGGELRLWSIDARGCGIPAVGMLAFPLCGGVSAGMLHGRGIGELDSRKARSPWVAMRAGPGLEVWPVRAFGVWIRAEGVFVVARPDFEVPQRGSVCCANIATLDAAAGVAVRFP
jgi:hypothetical protein